MAQPIRKVVLLADDSPASKEAVALLQNAHLPFTVVASDDDARGRSVPQLYTPQGVISHLRFIRQWVKRQLQPQP